MATALVDPENKIEHHEGPQTQLVAGEGTYTLQDDIRLAPPPFNAQETPNPNQNPLNTAPKTPAAGVRLSLSTVKPRKAPSQLYKISNSGSTRSDLATYSIREHEADSRSSHEQSSDGNTGQGSQRSRLGNTPTFGEDNLLLSPGSKEGLKRKKAKTNIVKSNSQYISRVIPHDAMSKRLQEHTPGGLLVAANIGRAFQFLDFSPTTFSKAEHLLKIFFAKAYVLCHDINQTTRTANHLDIVMGSSTGDIMWYEAFSQKYYRINKNNIVSDSSVSEIRWLPGSDNLFLAAHEDGTLIVYDMEREDAAIPPEENGLHQYDTDGVESEHKPLHITKSVNSKNQKTNPVASWKISNHKINAFDFSLDNRHLAVVSEDGSLRIIDFLVEQLKDIYTSYFGGFTCVCWSPDGKYILTGGQDDLVSVWSLAERRIVARCAGHQSWVTYLAFDPWRCDDRNYRFGSVGEDRRLLLWDFNVGMLHLPKAASARQRGSVASQPPARHRAESQTTIRRYSYASSVANSVEDEEVIEHAVESRTRTAELPPIMSRIIDEDPLTWIGFDEDSIITACKAGHVRIWSRPQSVVNPTHVR